MASQAQPTGWYPDPTGSTGKKYWDGSKWEQDEDFAGTAGSELPKGHGDHAAHASTGKAHLYKNPVLYAIGGLFLPPLVLFLMGGNRTTCAWILGLWLLFWTTVWFLGVGAIFAITADIWSVVACYREAVRQNNALGLS